MTYHYDDVSKIMET